MKEEEEEESMCGEKEEFPVVSLPLFLMPWKRREENRERHDVGSGSGKGSMPAAMLVQGLLLQSFM